MESKRRLANLKKRRSKTSHRTNIQLKKLNRKTWPTRSKSRRKSRNFRIKNPRSTTQRSLSSLHQDKTIFKSLSPAALPIISRNQSLKAPQIFSTRILSRHKNKNKCRQKPLILSISLLKIRKRASQRMLTDRSVILQMMTATHSASSMAPHLYLRMTPTRFL